MQNVVAIDPGRGEVGRAVTVDRGQIVDFTAGAARSNGDAARVDGGGRLLTPGLIDVHIHGVGHHLFEQSPDALLEGMRVLPRFGVTGVLPTLYRVMQPKQLHQLAALSAALDQVTCVHAPGFHLEGPFLALPGAGADTLDGDVSLVNDILAAAEGNVAAMSISPDTPNILPVIERLVEAGVVPFITHTHADVKQTQRAIEAGARHGTHFYDVFPIPEVTEPGVRPCGAVEALLADPRATVDFICDGVHVDPIAVVAALRAKGPEGVILITDANIGAGLPDGVYDTPWGFTVRVRTNDAARINDPGAKRDGCLAGSALTMNRGISNLLRWLDCAEHEVWGMGSRNVARLMGWSDRGRLRQGAAADMVLWDRGDDGTLHAVQTWVDGRCVFESSREGVLR